MSVFVVMLDILNDDHSFENAHLKYQTKLIDEGHLISSGPLTVPGQRSELWILLSSSYEEAEVIIKNDPIFARGLITNIRITEWDPILGVFYDLSSGGAS